MKTILSIRFRASSAVILSLMLTMLSACGGGGGSSGGGNNNNGGGDTTTTVSGTALAPSGVVAQLNNQSFMYAFAEFLFPSAGASITGLDPVQGALVELIEVDDNGVQVGPVLATTTTSITGDYELTLPAGVNLSANLVVRISGTSVDLRAMVVETAVDITPLSEYLLRKFIDSGTPLNTLLVSDVATLSGHAAEFDVAATSDLSSMIAALEAQLGPFVDASIVAISGTPGSASDFVGGYHHGAYQMGFNYLSDSMVPMLESEQTTMDNVGFATLTDGGGANIGAIAGPETHVDVGQSTSDNVNYWLGYGTDAAQGGQVIPNLGTVDSSGNVNLTFPFSENFNAGGTYGYRTPPTTENFYVSGVAGVLMGTGVDPSATYRLVDTNGDGVNDAVDPSAVVGREYNFTFDVVAQQAGGLTLSNMAGDYGTISLANSFASAGGQSSVYSGVTEATVGISGDLSNTANDAVNFARTPDPAGSGSATIAESADTTLNTGTLSIDGNGQLTYSENGSTTSFFGFASSNAEFLMVNLSDTEGTAPDFVSLGSGLSLAVRRPSGSAPDLSGRTYRLMGIEKNMDTTGEIRFQRLRGDDDRLIFNSDGSQVSVVYNGLDTITRASDNSDFTIATVTDSGTINHSVTVLSGGAINFTQTVAGTDGYVREWKGFVSASTNIIILRSIERANDGTGYAAGLYVAIPVN